MIHNFGNNIWIVDGDTVIGAGGFHFPTRMTVMRLSNRDLMIISPVAGITQKLRERLAGLGPVAHIIAPNNLHHLALAEWVAAYPDALVHGAAGVRAKQPDITVHHDLTATPHPAWARDVDQIMMSGNAITTEVVFFHMASRTAVFTDLLQNMPKRGFKGIRKIIAQLDLMIGDTPQVPRKFRVAFIRRSKAKTAARKILMWPTDGVIMAHGTPVKSGGKAFLRNAFAWLVPPTS